MRTLGTISTQHRPTRAAIIWLAVASLAMQLVLAAWHFHPDELVTAFTAPAAAAKDGGQQPMAPALPAHGECTLCVSLHFAGTPVLPEAIVLPAPPPAPSISPTSGTDFLLVSAAWLLLPSRGPPLT